MHGDMGHDMPDMPDMSCQMKMTLNWDLDGICVIFDWWLIDGAFRMLVSCLAVAVWSMGYEWLRLVARGHDARLRNGMRKTTAVD